MQSRIVLAPGSELGRLRPHLARDRLIDVSSLAELSSAIRDGGVRWVVLDPMVLSEYGFRAAIDAICVAGLRVAFYSRFEGFDHGRLLRALDHVMPEIVFSETDDDWIRMTAILRCDQESVAAHVLGGLGARVQELGERTMGRTVGLFGALRVPADVEAFARSCGIPAWSVRAAYQHVGLATPHDMLDIARLAYAYADLRALSLSLQSLAERHGFDTDRTLERRSHELVGLPARKAVRECDCAEFARRLLCAANR